ncbi:MAG TPA: hypothetical protein VFI84_02740 [Candidatus Saccharimonadales bacterium]|nr:hypothetical protein [Candidatus Saccharimonadales bacterium]
MTLKDFTYLDSERIRSYLAQLDGSVNESMMSTSEHSTKADIKAGSGHLTKMIADAEAKGGYLYKKSNTETSSLHHAVFDLFEQRIEKNKLIGTLSDEKPFTEITCRLRVADYQLLAQQFQATASLMPLIGRITAQQNHQQGNKQTNEEKAQAKQIKDIASAIELLFGEVRILQLINSAGEIIAQASLDDELLPEHSLFFARNNEVLPQEYTVFCLKQSSATEIPAVQEAGDDFSKAITGAVSSLATMRETLLPTSSVPSIVPIAIYRKVSSI